MACYMVVCMCVCARAYVDICVVSSNQSAPQIQVHREVTEVEGLFPICQQQALNRT